MPYEYSRAKDRREITTYVFESNGKDIAGGHYSIKRSASNLFSTADLLSGFIFKDTPDPSLISFLLGHFLNWAEGQNVSYARYTPWLPELIAGESTSYASWFEKEVNQLGFKPIKKGRQTYWIDLTLSEEELISRMRSQTKTKIKKGIKSNVQSECYDKPESDKIDVFWRLYEHLGKKKNFKILSESRFKNEVVSMMESGLASLFILSFEGIVINAALSGNFGRAMYFHGALNPEYKNIKNCPSPGHIAQWGIITNMKSRGLKSYDMAYCPGPVPVEGDPNYEIWRFKYGFGGDHISYLPVFGKRMKPIRGWIFEKRRGVI
jgi:hypothetical protein